MHKRAQQGSARGLHVLGNRMLTTNPPRLHHGAHASESVRRVPRIAAQARATPPFGHTAGPGGPAECSLHFRRSQGGAEPRSAAGAMSNGSATNCPRLVVCPLWSRRAPDCEMPDKPTGWNVALLSLLKVAGWSPSVRPQPLSTISVRKC